MKVDVYGGRDPRDLPAYTVVEAAHYLRIPENTVRAWTFGRSFSTLRGARHAKPVVVPADRAGRLLSFVNLLELHVLDAIRRRHRVQLPRVRNAVDYLRERYGVAHPLVEQAMETDGVDLFVERYGRLVNVSREGQGVIRDLMRLHLDRIERDTRGLAVRLFPFTRRPTDVLAADRQPRIVAIDPRVAFGRPVLTGSRIPTIEIAERYKAGDSIAELAADYDRSAVDIEEAIRCELRLDAA